MVFIPIQNHQAIQTIVKICLTLSNYTTPYSEYFDLRHTRLRSVHFKLKRIIRDFFTYLTNINQVLRDFVT